MISISRSNKIGNLVDISAIQPMLYKPRIFHGLLEIFYDAFVRHRDTESRCTFGPFNTFSCKL